MGMRGKREGQRKESERARKSGRQNGKLGDLRVARRGRGLIFLGRPFRAGVDVMSGNPGQNAASGLYHERQRLELCAVHALNNVLQERRFTQEAADEICKKPLEQLSLEGVFGFIVNVPSNVCLGFLSLPLRRRHWFAVRQLDGIYYNLDSKLKAPAPIGGEADLRVFLQDVLSQGPCELLLVVPQETGEAGNWLSTVR
ncbi:josephin-2 isoform X2 [Elgaria multicarinata webbii]|uniref:josephin-2 isoform X2 n=1 Tax=Elgaria multicarinata webbii TaxID=159646 RepID=UPI002FCCCEE5